MRVIVRYQTSWQGVEEKTFKATRRLNGVIVDHPEMGATDKEVGERVWDQLALWSETGTGPLVLVTGSQLVVLVTRVAVAKGMFSPEEIVLVSDGTPIWYDDVGSLSSWRGLDITNEWMLKLFC